MPYLLFLYLWKRLLDFTSDIDFISGSGGLLI